MSTKHKPRHSSVGRCYQARPGMSSRRQLDVARQAYASGKMCAEDFIWAAMQCYAADNQSKSS